MASSSVEDVLDLSDWGARIGDEARKSFKRHLREGFIAKYLSGRHVLDIGYRGYRDDVVPIVPHAIGIELDYPGYDGITLPFDDNSQDTVFSSHALEHIVDYRTSLREWFRVLKVGGHLIISVPHQYLYEKKLTMPSNFNADHKRFYTPGILLMQVEEALEPFSYRVRLLEDNDRDYNYGIPPRDHAEGCYEIVLVIEKIARPSWADEVMDLEPKPEPREQSFVQFPKDTTAEHIAAIIPHPTTIRSVLVTKLDHRGDFIIAEKAFRVLRGAFPDAALTLACGPWNRAAAEELGLFDQIVPVAFFSEDMRHDAPIGALSERIDVFEGVVKGQSFDLAIDLRIDPDTRPLLQHVNAHYRAGFGTRWTWPFLDFSLPYLNPSYSCRAERLHIAAAAFSVLVGRHEGFRIRVGEEGQRRGLGFGRSRNRRKRVLIHGPYKNLEAGSYAIEPLLNTYGRTINLTFDIAADGGRRIIGGGEMQISNNEARPYVLQLDEPVDAFEFRIIGNPTQGQYDFVGLTMTKLGEHDSFHQEEALVMLSVMTAIRLENPSDVVTIEPGV